MQALATTLPWSKLRLALEVMFEGVEGAGTMPVTGLLPLGPGTTPGQQEAEAVNVGGMVTVRYRSANRRCAWARMSVWDLVTG